MDSAFEQFPESCIQDNEIWVELASDDATKVISGAVKENISEATLKRPAKVTLPENSKFAQAKLANPVVSFNKECRYKTPSISMQYVKINWVFDKATLADPQHVENKQGK